jgi:MFS family permease
MALIGSSLSTLAIFASSFVVDLKLYFLTYGVLFGIGQALLLISTSAILPHYFKRRLALANGLMNFLGSLIVITIPILTSIVLNKYHLKEAFLLLSGLNFLTILFSLSYISRLPNPNKNKKVIERVKSSFGFEIFKNKKYILWVVTISISLFGWLIPIINIVISD